MSRVPSLPSPSTATSEPGEAFVTYLDFFRDAARRKVADLDRKALQESLLPSGWTPVELISHLAHMERRWLVHGFLGEQVDDPWGDNEGGTASGRWATDRTLDDLLTAMADGGRRTAEIVATHDLLAHAATGGRFPDGEPTPTLIAILFHVMQEYARHLGHLDIVRELIDGATGED
jgi:uncharacterized damage-inducible protein DinB